MSELIYKKGYVWKKTKTSKKVKYNFWDKLTIKTIAFFYDTQAILMFDGFEKMRYVDLLNTKTNKIRRIFPK